MNAYLLLWNPKKWQWDTLEEEVEQVGSNNLRRQSWSCGNTKAIRPNDRLFLLKVGAEPKGIMASGYSRSAPSYGRHWSGEDRDTLYVDIDFDVLLNPNVDPLLSVESLKHGKLGEQNWQPQGSGVSIRPEIIADLEEVWFDFLTSHKIRNNPFTPLETDGQKVYLDGAPNQTQVTIYERNPYARKRCLDHYGYSCSVCDFNFESVYGQIGKEFIHVHHLNQIAGIGREHTIDPIRDLRPVCPNCHAMIHKNKTALTIDEVRELLRKKD